MAEFRLRLRSRARYTGPLLDEGHTRRVFRDFADDLEEDGAEFALDHIQRTYHTHFKRPTGYYESNVRIRRTSTGREVWDGGWAGPVYGPWLEGVGSRNNTTRFKGYHAFRNAARALELRIQDMGDNLFRTRYRNRLE